MNIPTACFRKQRAWVALIIFALLTAASSYCQPAATQPPINVSEQPPPGNPQPVTLSPAAAEVVKLAESGVGEEVVLAYVNNSAGAFDLTADQLLYLRDVGLSSQVITAMLTRDSTLKGQSPAQPPSGPAPSQAAPAEPAVAPPSVPVEAPLTPPAATEVVAPPVQVNYFYSDLAPYGTWVDLEGIGWCWQPSAVVINRSWRPYCDGGYWVYSNCGWYWQSSYSWGWAPFHYGRWHLHPRSGWVWLPDTVWAPAWVIWRSSGDYCGWAPLPPHAVFDVGVGWRFNGLRVGVDFDFGLHANHFTFISFHDFNERDIHRHRLAPVEVTRIYNHTTIINNYTVNNKVIVNRGVEVNRVTAAARTPIRRAEVREAPAHASRTMAGVQNVEKGTAVVYRPQLRASPRATPVRIQKVDEKHPVIQHTPAVAVASPSRGGWETRTPSANQRAFSPASSASRAERLPPGGPSRSAVEHPANRTQPQPRTIEPARPSQSTPRGHEAPPARSAPGNRNNSAALAAPSAPTATQPSQDYKQPGRVTPTYRTESNPAGFPLQSRGGAGSPTFQPGHAARPDSDGGNSHVYYPKSFHQSSEGRSASPGASRSAPGQQTGNPNSRKKDF